MYIYQPWFLIVVIVCVVGTYNNDVLCADCQQGTYNSQLNQTLCDPCPSNSTTMRQGATSIDACGEFSDFSTLSCNGRNCSIPRNHWVIYVYQNGNYGGIYSQSSISKIQSCNIHITCTRIFTLKLQICRTIIDVSISD